MKKVILPGAAIFYLTVVILSSENELFWDSILLSGRYGVYYFEHYFKALFVPDDIAGYPPLWGYYLATVWKLTGGPSLIWSHLAMWPWLLLLLSNAWQLIRIWQLRSPSWFLILCILLEPVLLAQATQVAPDLALAALTMGGIAANYTRNKWKSILYVVLLVWLSPRGGFHAVALLCLAIWQAVVHSRCFKHAVWVGAGFLLAAGTWYVLHFLHFGWIGYQPESQWSAFTRLVDFEGFFRNVAVVAHRLADMNRWALWMLLLWLMWRVHKTGKLKTAWTHPVLVCALLLIMAQLPIWLLYRNPVGHRYLIVPFIFFSWYISEWATRFERMQTLVYCLMVTALISAHWMIFPFTRARGWDATLAHVPYFKLRKHAVVYLKKHAIPSEKVCTWFPADGLEKFMVLQDDFTAINSCDGNRAADYVVWSNVFNVQPPEHNMYTLLWEEKSGQVVMQIWQSNEP